VIQHDPMEGAFREGEPPLTVARPSDRITNSNAYHEPLLTALTITFIFSVLSVLTMDGGETVRLTAIGLVIFWGWVFYARWRRAAFPTKVDLLLIKWGCIPLVIGFQAAMYFAWRLRGLWV
jgi:hypothetical protein